MKEVWTKSWKKVLIWACGFASIVAFAVVGGYAIVKEDEEVKRTAKNCFIVTLIFLAVNAAVSILSGISGFAASAGFNTFLRWLNFILLFVKIAVYAAAVVMALIAAKNETSSGRAEPQGQAAEVQDPEKEKENDKTE